MKQQALMAALALGATAAPINGQAQVATCQHLNSPLERHTIARNGTGSCAAGAGKRGHGIESRGSGAACQARRRARVHRRQRVERAVGRVGFQNAAVGSDQRF